MAQWEDVRGRSVRLTDERLAHIESEHPEMEGQIARIAATLLDPDVVVRSRVDAEVEQFYRYYGDTPVGGKQMCVMVKGATTGPFVVTAYLTDAVKRGEELWRRK